MGAVTSILANSIQNRQGKDFGEIKDSEGANMGFEADSPLRQLIQVQQSVTLTKPTVPYNRKIAKLLVLCCRLATEQYLKGTEDLNYEGSIQSLASYTSELAEYQQLIAFKTDRKKDWIRDLVDQKFLKRLRMKTNLIYYGFALTSATHNLIVYRGTQEPEEWIANLNAAQIDYKSSRSNLDAGLVHDGFYSIYQKEIAQQTLEVVKQFNPNIPCYIAGHSLGGAIAVLAALDMSLNFPLIQSQIRMYNYGAPRVGNPTFAQFYSQQIPNSYRIVNWADITPLLPPTQFQKSHYLHVGQEWFFLKQTGDMSPNHQLPTYYAAIDQVTARFEGNNSPN